MMVLLSAKGVLPTKHEMSDWFDDGEGPPFVKFARRDCEYWTSARAEDVKIATSSSTTKETSFIM